jgi:hypothetical protein
MIKYGETLRIAVSETGLNYDWLNLLIHHPGYDSLKVISNFFECMWDWSFGLLQGYRHVFLTFFGV